MGRVKNTGKKISSNLNYKKIYDDENNDSGDIDSTTEEDNDSELSDESSFIEEKYYEDNRVLLNPEWKKIASNFYKEIESTEITIAKLTSPTSSDLQQNEVMNIANDNFKKFDSMLENVKDYLARAIILTKNVKRQYTQFLARKIVDIKAYDPKNSQLSGFLDPKVYCFNENLENELIAKKITEDDLINKFEDIIKEHGKERIKKCVNDQCFYPVSYSLKNVTEEFMWFQEGCEKFALFKDFHLHLERTSIILSKIDKNNPNNLLENIRNLWDVTDTLKTQIGKLPWGTTELNDIKEDRPIFMLQLVGILTIFLGVGIIFLLAAEYIQKQGIKNRSCDFFKNRTYQAGERLHNSILNFGSFIKELKSLYAHVTNSLNATNITKDLPSIK